MKKYVYKNGKNNFWEIFSFFLIFVQILHGLGNYTNRAAMHDSERIHIAQIARVHVRNYRKKRRKRKR